MNYFWYVITIESFSLYVTVFHFCYIYLKFLSWGATCSFTLELDPNSKFLGFPSEKPITLQYETKYTQFIESIKEIISLKVS